MDRTANSGRQTLAADTLGLLARVRYKGREYFAASTGRVPRCPGRWVFNVRAVPIRRAHMRALCCFGVPGGRLSVSELDRFGVD